MMLNSSSNSWITQFLAFVGSCFGCCTTKSQPLNSKPMYSEDFWSTSTCDLDVSAFQSQKSFSSITVPNLGPGSSSNHSDFVNHGLLLWNQSRHQWVGNRKPQSRKKVVEPVLSWNVSYDSLLGTGKRFPQPIPLPEMVDFLVEIWELEGLYG
ncbi:hypothetical protein ACJIZ3_021129 [Penstemon smallii]|uniref:Gag1-like clamp domain-containing protein n=1 Tax=Penstemon smallii TaxID=265156 RepID=A0ABD3SL80_9LAMI